MHASLVAQMVKSLPATLETQVQSVGQKNPLEEELATHSRILAWEIPWTEEPGGLQSMGHTESDTTEWLNTTLMNVTRDMKQDIWVNFIPNILKLYIYIYQN